mmetsp:Transcript_7977/g.18503  ORF Transcript_7977/g.18503 Transcript_7977/m.18503 type:complete len:619 (+) Transcript_7977:62-1918(+)
MADVTEGQDDDLPAAPGQAEGSSVARMGNGMGDTSPRCAVVLDAPLANPIFMSDAPSFLQRQRNRAAKALVSEHAGTITCRCQKCAEAARARAGPSVSPDWPLPPVKLATSPFDDTLATPAAPIGRLQPSTPHGRRSPPMFKRGVGEALALQTAGNMAADQRPLSSQTVKRDFTWLLRVMSELAPSDGTGRVAGHVSYDGTWVPEPMSLQGKLGIIVPDTVVLEKGKPKRRYHLDPGGRVQVTRMKTSAELLRVLRDFVRKATKPREPAGRQGSKVLTGSKSESSLQVCTTPSANTIGVASILDSRASATGGPTAIPQIEVAVLCYDDGLSRLMMLAEAVSQIRGASKLPREFWQHIHVLQVPIQSKKAGIPTRYITYSFDINSGGLEPQEPMPLGGGARLRLRSASHQASGGRNWAATQKSNESEAARLAAVPKRLNEYLRSKTRRVGMEIVQGQFEFVLDEADGTLWLANASNLRCRFLPKSSSDDKDGHAADDVVRFFEEEEFEEELQETEASMEKLKKRFGGDPGVAHGGTGVAGISVSASDQLAGIRVPSNLVRFYEEEEKMLRYYEDGIRVMLLRREKPLTEGSRAVGLGCWFRRWVRAVKGPRPSRRAILE